MPKSYLYLLRLFLIIFQVLLCSSGCGGGFAGGNSEEGTSGADTAIFLSGRATLPFSVSAAVQKSVSGGSAFGINRGKLGLYAADDLFFTQNLLRSGTDIYTDVNGNFAILRQELSSGIFPAGTQQKSFILRITFSDFELCALLAVQGENLLSGSVLNVNPLSDGPVSYIRSELLAKTAGVSDAASYRNANWKNELELLATDFALQAEKMQLWAQAENLSLDDYRIERSLSQRNAGRKWGEVFRLMAGITGNEQTADMLLWSELYTRTTMTAMNASLGNCDLSTSVIRQRKLSLLYGALEQGFPAVDTSGRIFMKDTINNLDERYVLNSGGDSVLYKPFTPSMTIGEQSLYVSTATLFSGLISGITAEDSVLFPSPADIVGFSPQELSDFGQQPDVSINAGMKVSGFAEKMVLTARKAVSLPWIFPELLDALAASCTVSWPQPETVFRVCAGHFQQQRYSVERVNSSRSGAGLIFFGPGVSPAMAFGGFSMSPKQGSPAFSTLWGFWRDQVFNNDFTVYYNNFIRQRPFYFSFFPDYYHLKHADMVKRGENFAGSSYYPDPVTENASRNLLFQNVGEEIVTGTSTIKRELDFFRRVLYPLWLKRNDNEYGADRLFSLIRVFASLVFPLSGEIDNETAFFKSFQTSTYSGQSPFAENIAYGSFPVSSSPAFWFELFPATQNAASTIDFQSLQNSLDSLCITTISHLSTLASTADEARPKGSIVLGKKVDGSLIPGANFPVFATPVAGGTVYTTKTDINGNYSFAQNPLVPNQAYRFYVELKNILPDSFDALNPLTADFSWYVTGHEANPELPFFRLDSEVSLLSTTFNLRQQTEELTSLLLPLKSPPEIRFCRFSEAETQLCSAVSDSQNPLPEVNSGVIPLNFLLFDEDSDNLNVRFSFTAGSTQEITTAAPRISLFSSPIGFPQNGEISSLISAPAGAVNTIYWHTAIDTGLNGSISNSPLTTVQLCLGVFSGSGDLPGNRVCSNLFLLDYGEPELEIISPSSTDSPVTTDLVTISGRATDHSSISSFSVINQTHSSQVYEVLALSENYQTWEVPQVAVVYGVENILAFELRDEFGNEAQSPVTAAFFSQDSRPPVLTLSSVEVFSLRSSVLQGSYTELYYRSQAADPLYSLPASPVGTGTIYTLPEPALEISLPIITSRLLRFRGEARDENDIVGIGLVDELTAQDTAASFSVDGQGGCFWELLYEVPSGRTTNLNLFLYAVDEHNNSSASQSLSSSRVSLHIDRVDVDPPELVLLSPGSSLLPETVTTDLITMSGLATDISTIVSFVLCNQSLCREAITTNNFRDWQVSMPLSDGRSNPITGVITDEFGFKNTYNSDLPFKVYNLNDITPPVFTINAVNGVALTTEIYVDKDFVQPPGLSSQLFSAIQCSGNICTAAISGFLRDESGLDLQPDALSENFSGFKLRFNHYGLAGFVPGQFVDAVDLYGDGVHIFANQLNKTIITTQQWLPGINSSGIQTEVSYEAVFHFDNDGYWPLWLRANDGSSEKFSPFTTPVLDKRGVVYVKRDTVGPEINEIQLSADEDGYFAGLIPVNILLSDALSDIAGVVVTNSEGVAFSYTTADFSVLSSDSEWLSFMSGKGLLSTDVLPTVSSVRVSAWLTQKTGYNQALTVSALDEYGNESSRSVTMDVLPLFSAELKPAENDFGSPLSMFWGGTDFDRVFVLDGEADSIKSGLVASLPFSETITGNQRADSTFYTGFSSGVDFAVYYRRFLGELNNEITSHSLLLHGFFTAEQGGNDNYGLIRLVDDNGLFVSADEDISSNAYHVFRDSPLSGTAALIPESSIFAFTPLLENVVYVFQPDNGGNDQLFRFVNGFRGLTASLPPQQGGSAVSTGIYGIETHQLSMVQGLAVTQVHSIGNPDPADDRSDEWLFIARREPARISRFHYRNLPLNNDGGFTALAPIELDPSVVGGIPVSGLTTALMPTAIAVEDSGEFIYIGNSADQKIYKIALSSESAQLFTSFGSGGVGEGRFSSIDQIYGYKARQLYDQPCFTELYVVDKTAEAISVWSTNGEFKHFYGQNDYSVGGMPKPVQIGVGGMGTGSDGEQTLWYVVDQKMDTLTFYNNQDQPNARFSILDAGWENGFKELSALAVSEPYQPENTLITEIFWSDHGLAVDRVYHTVRNTVTQTFTAVLPIETAQPLFNLRDMTMVQSPVVTGVLLLENLSSTQDRVQWYSHYGSKYHVNAAVSVPSALICNFTSGVALIGGGSHFMVHNYSPGITVMGPAAGFAPVPLVGFLGENIMLSNPRSAACDAGHIFIADGSRILGFQTPTDYGNGPEIRLIKEIREPAQTLSTSLELMLREGFLYVLDREGSLVRKYRY